MLKYITFTMHVSFFLSVDLHVEAFKIFFTGRSSLSVPDGTDPLTYTGS